VAQAQAAQTTAEAAYEVALAALSTAQTQLAQATLTAPFAGTVVALHVAVGELAAPGVPVVQLADLTHWQVRTSDLAETDVALVRVGQAATVTLDALDGVELAGTVSALADIAETNRGNVTYAVTVTLNPTDAPLRWGMTAFADLLVGP
jgi:HlyD family secretion protein